MYKCKKCGNPLEKGQTNCSVCGEAVYTVPREKKSMLLCILTAIIYPAIFLSLNLMIYLIGASSIYGLIPALLCIAGSVACIVVGGFYLLVVPLPFIMFWKAGCLRPEIIFWKRVLLGFGALLFPLAGMGFLYLGHIIV